MVIETSDALALLRLRGYRASRPRIGSARRLPRCIALISGILSLPSRRASISLLALAAAGGPSERPAWRRALGTLPQQRRLTRRSPRTCQPLRALRSFSILPPSPASRATYAAESAAPEPSLKLPALPANRPSLASPSPAPPGPAATPPPYRLLPARSPLRRTIPSDRPRPGPISAHSASAHCHPRSRCEMASGLASKGIFSSLSSLVVPS